MGASIEEISKLFDRKLENFKTDFMEEFTRKIKDEIVLEKINPTIKEHIVLIKYNAEVLNGHETNLKDQEIIIDNQKSLLTIRNHY